MQFAVAGPLARAWNQETGEPSKEDGGAMAQTETQCQRANAALATFLKTQPVRCWPSFLAVSSQRPRTPSGWGSTSVKERPQPRLGWT